jgi:hypothetical protein
MPDLDDLLKGEDDDGDLTDDEENEQFIVSPD